MDELLYCLDCKVSFQDTTSGGAAPCCGGSRIIEKLLSSTPMRKRAIDGSAKMTDGQGKIEEMTMKENRFSFKIGGRYFSMWANGETDEEKAAFMSEISRGYKAGDYVNFTYTEKANPSGGAAYKNIRTIKKGTPPAPGAAGAAPGVTYTDPQREQNIRRQCAVKTAAEFLKACPHVINEKTPIDTLIATANAIDQWLTLPLPVKSTAEPVKKPAPKGDGAAEDDALNAQEDDI